MKTTLHNLILHTIVALFIFVLTGYAFTPVMVYFGFTVASTIAAYLFIGDYFKEPYSILPNVGKGFLVLAVSVAIILPASDTLLNTHLDMLNSDKKEIATVLGNQPHKIGLNESRYIFKGGFYTKQDLLERLHTTNKNIFVEQNILNTLGMTLTQFAMMFFILQQITIILVRLYLKHRNNKSR